jgi:hypothetical protein
VHQIQIAELVAAHCRNQGLTKAPLFFEGPGRTTRERRGANAGGLINVCHELRGYNAEHALDDARKIYHTLMEIFIKADSKGITTLETANAIAESKIKLTLERGGQRLYHTYNNQPWIKTRR